MWCEFTIRMARCNLIIGEIGETAHPLSLKCLGNLEIASKHNHMSKESKTTEQTVNNFKMYGHLPYAIWGSCGYINVEGVFLQV